MGWDLSLLFVPRPLEATEIVEAARAAYSDGAPANLVALIADEKSGPSSIAKHFERFSVVSLWAEDPLHAWDALAREISRRASGAKALLVAMSDHAGVGGYRVLESGEGAPGEWFEENYTAGPREGFRAAFGVELEVEAEDLALGAERGVALFSKRPDYPAGVPFGAEAARAVIEAGSLEWCCAPLDLRDLAAGGEPDVGRYLLLAEAAELDLDTADALVEEHPDDARARLVRGVARLTHGILEQEGPRLFEGALEDARAAIERDATLVRARMLRADVLAALGRPAEAIPDLDAVLAAQPQNAHAIESRGVARFFAGELAGARADLDEAIVLEPSAYARWVRGLLRHASGDARGAILDARLGLALDAAFLPAAFLLGALGELSKSLDGVSGGFEKSLAAYLRGRLVEVELLAAANGDREPARRACEARAYLALTALHRGDAAAAREHAQRCVATDAADQLEHAWAREWLRGC